MVLRTTGSEETQAPAGLAFWYHATALACVEGLQEPHHLVHVRTLIRVRVPALPHDVRHWAWAAARNVRPQVLHTNRWKPSGVVKVWHMHAHTKHY